MPLASGAAAWSAVAAVLVGTLGVAAALVVDDDDGPPGALGARTTTSQAGGDGAPSTTAPPELATTAPDTTTSSASTTTAVTTTTSTTAATTTTPAPCGAGKATVSFAAKDLVTDVDSSEFTPQATVDNQVSAAIEVEELVVDVVYPGGEVRTVRFATAGIVIQPATSASFTAERLTSAKRYESARFTRFAYFTHGQPERCRVSAP